MKILITGGDGQLGSFLIKLLKSRNLDVFAFNKRELDITNEYQVDLIFSQYKPDVVINAAAFTAVEQAETNIGQSLSVNCNGVKHVANAAKKIDAFIIHISTDYIFDGSKNSAYLETDPPCPKNIYGSSKLAGEIILKELLTKFIIIRTAWLFGGSGINFFNKITNSLISSSKIQVVNDQVGNPTYVGDLADFILIMILRYSSEGSLPWGIYNYAGTPAVSWFEFSSYIKQSLKTEHACILTPVSSDRYPSAAARPLNSSLDSSLAGEIFGVLPSDWKRAVLGLCSEMHK